jgi:outer membrane murein-binding lipoprotein Lpp
MNQTDMLTAFVAVTALAVILQMLILAGLYFSMRKTGERVTAMQAKLNEQLLPLLAKLRVIVDESAPKLQTTLENVAQTTTIVRAQAEKIDHAVTGAVQVASDQVHAAGELAARTMERVDDTAHAVQHAVIAPVRKLSALLGAVAVGFGDFSGRRKVDRTKSAVPKDQMFV